MGCWQQAETAGTFTVGTRVSQKRCLRAEFQQVRLDYSTFWNTFSGACNYLNNNLHFAQNSPRKKKNIKYLYIIINSKQKILTWLILDPAAIWTASAASSSATSTSSRCVRVVRRPSTVILTASDWKEQNNFCVNLKDVLCIPSIVTGYLRHNTAHTICICWICN